ncbi:flagellar hook-basal body complex protein FliE [Geodermatophilus sp. TF02-6]|uniref:flagellar hook-basal body complex protein FliE n=1 Tax=Geodermatophilus sp. TF02-6 TaxID=2250575 RepID=UPI000DE9C412|nr:flagellar hook-basal body complex protein FliE [Geodermatophilus sp. TF02-6]RBY79626.1 flagellar hook-basal body complex protein FliE [Geodermatophilus sp. TF02-6]
MTSAIGGISFPVVPTPGVAATTGTEAVTGTRAAASDGGFAAVLAASLDQLQATQSASDSLATQAATGELRDVHDYTIAANEAELATETVVTLKNKAVEAFTEIMRMPV